MTTELSPNYILPDRVQDVYNFNDHAYRRLVENIKVRISFNTS